MKKRLAAAAMIALSVQCTAANAGEPSDETVVVEASALIGIWKISTPSEFNVSFSQKAQFGAMVDRFCRIDRMQDDLVLGCLKPNPSNNSGTVSVHDAKIHLAWGSALARMVIDGTLQSSSRFDGTFGFKVMGIEYKDPSPSIGTKLTVSPVMPDKAGKSKLLAHLLGEMAKGRPTESFDAKSESVHLPTSGALLPLGAVQTISYLGETQKWDGASKRFIGFLSVYEVEFANGQRLCGLHQRNDDVLDGLVCV